MLIGTRVTPLLQEYDAVGTVNMVRILNVRSKYRASILQTYIYIYTGKVHTVITRQGLAHTCPDYIFYEYRRVGLSSALQYLAHILNLAHILFLSQTKSGWGKLLNHNIIDHTVLVHGMFCVSTVCMQRNLDALVCTLSCCKTAS